MSAIKSTNQESNKNKYGQYFTPIDVANFMVELTDKPKDCEVLDPCCGTGVFLEALTQKGYTNLSAYEIDRKLPNPFSFVKYRSFIGVKRLHKFDLIIGNPPYIRWRNIEDRLKQELLDCSLWNDYCNSLCDYLQIFILKSIELLNEGGELIFICPEYWMHTTHSRAMRNYMLDNGYFTKIVHFNEGRIFKGVNVATVVFKYVKGTPADSSNQAIAINKCSSVRRIQPEYLEAMLNNDNIEYVESFLIPQFVKDSPWVMEGCQAKQELENFEKSCTQEIVLGDGARVAQLKRLKDYCRVANGMVSGLDKVFCLPKDLELDANEQSSVLKVIKARELAPYYAGAKQSYFFVKSSLSEGDFKLQYPNLSKYLGVFKDQLKSRYLMNEDVKYWEWAFPRNYHLLTNTSSEFKEQRIFVPCKERISNKNYFRFAIVDKDSYPTQDVTAILPYSTTRESVEYIVAFLNQPIVFNWLRTYGIVKGNIVEFSYNPVSSIPFLAIDWQKPEQVRLHEEITQAVKAMVDTPQEEAIAHIQELFKQLLG